MFAASVGDSAVILGKVDPIKGVVGEMVTKPHRPNVKEESDRIKECGGKVIEIKNVMRVIYEPGANDKSQQHNQLPKLNLTRSLGDIWSFNNKKGSFLISPIPDVFIRFLDSAVHKYILLLTDGVLDVMDHNMCVKWLHDKSKGHIQDIYEASKIAERLLDAALKEWRDKNLLADNVSALTVFIIPSDINYMYRK